MHIRDVMTESPEVTPPDASLKEAAAIMRDLNVGSVPVCDNDRLVGMLTDRDIAIRAAAEGRQPTSTKVKEAMSAGVVFCFEDDDLSEAVKLMEQKQIRRLPVLNREKTLVGIVSLGDLAVNGDQREAGAVLERVSKPAQPNR